MNEGIPLSSPEDQEVPTGIKIDYELTDTLGGNAEKHVITDFNLVVNGEAAFAFDGYISVPGGDFAFQGPLREAKKVLAAIETYSKLTTEILGLRNHAEEARRDVASKGDHFRRTDDSRPLTEAWDRRDELAARLSRMERDLREAANKVAPYRL